MDEDEQIPLPNGWMRAALSQFGQLYCGQSPAISEVNTECRGEPYFTGPEQWDGHKLRVNKWTEHPRRLVPDGCIFITVKGAGVGKMFPGVAGAIGRDIYAFHVRKLLDYRYVFYALKFTVNQVIRQAQGDIPGLSKSHILDHKIGLPGIDQQIRIVAKIEELFSELDKGIENLKTAREQLKVYRHAVLKHAFEGKLTTQWREANKDKLETAEQLFARIKKGREARYQQQLADWQAASRKWEASGTRRKKPSKPKAPKSLAPISAEELLSFAHLPSGWAYVRLGEVIDEPAYGTSKRCDYDIKGIGVLRIPNVAQGAIDTTDLKFAQFDDEEIEAYRIMAGDILTIRSNGSVSLVGRCALTSASEEQYLYAGYLIRLRPNHALVNSHFLITALSNHTLRGQIEGKAKSTSGVNNINSGEIQHLILPLCGTAEQEALMERLADILSSIEATESEIDEQIKRAQSARQSILNKAFSGRLVAQHPNDEPASALLDRIRRENVRQPRGQGRPRSVNQVENA